MKIFNLIPQNFNLSRKLTTLMLTIFLAGIIVSSFTFYNVLIENAENELNRQANVLISAMDSVRKQTADNLTPLLRNNLEEEFLSESVPAVSVNRVFDILTTAYKDKYGEYNYKDAMINPSNPKNKATEQEMTIIEKLRQQDKEGKVENIAQGFLNIDGENKFYTARPIKITQNSCLSCHSTLEKAPKSLQILYEKGKFQYPQGMLWELNKVIGTKIITIPSSQVYKIAKRNLLLILGTFIAIFAVTTILVSLWLKQYIIRPINRITRVAEAVSLGDMDANFEKNSNDEIGRLGESFGRMKESFNICMTKLIKKSHCSSDESTNSYS